MTEPGMTLLAETCPNDPQTMWGLVALLLGMGLLALVAFAVYTWGRTRVTRTVTISNLTPGQANELAEKVMRQHYRTDEPT